MRNLFARVEPFHFPWSPASFDASGGESVGSGNTQDQFLGYGTEFNNADRFRVDISDVIHLLGADQTKLISWIQGKNSKPTDQIQFTHMENELFTVRDFKAKLKRYDNGTTDYVWMLELDTPQDWQAIETAPLGDGAHDDDKPGIYMTVQNPLVSGEQFSVQIDKYALRGATSRTVLEHDGSVDNGPNLIKDAIVIASGTAASPTVGGSTACVGSATPEVSAVDTGVGAGAFVGTEWDNTDGDEVYVNVVTPERHLQGMPQGSGLPNETRKHSRSLQNFVQIFKTPLTVTNTLKKISMRGGDELGILRLRKLIQHKTELEYAMLFQAGGTEHTDYGILDSGDENPLTRFKGLGIGLAQTGNTLKPGWIETKNADLNSNFQLDWDSATIYNDLQDMLEKVFDDLVDDPSATKVMMCSNKWLNCLSKIAGSRDDGGFVMGDHTVTNTLGISGIRTLTCPTGTLRLMPFKHFRGRFENYACVLDLKNIKYRPLRPTEMFSNVSSDEVDGQKDFFIIEAGMQVMHESTHAVLKLV